MAAIDLAKQVGTTKGDLYVYNGSTLVRLPVGSDDQVLKAASGAPSGVQWANESGGGGSLTVEKSQGTAANTDITTTSTSYVDLGSISETIAASEGDELEVCLTGSVYRDAGSSIDFRFAVAGTRVGPGWRVTPAASFALTPISIVYTHTVVAGDLSAGSVTVNPEWKTSGGTAYFVEQANIELVWQFVVKNLG